MNSAEHKYRWREDGFNVTRTTCWSPPGCHGGCGVLLYSQGGKLVKVEGDPSNRFNRGKICVRCRNLTEVIYHKDRITTPLIRDGKRGENRWQAISYDEALDVAADKFLRLKKEFGAESVIFAKGTARDINGWLPRLCYGFGSPNYFGFGPGNGNACFRPRVSVSRAILGKMPVPDLGQYAPAGTDPVLPECILVWGANPEVSNPDGLHGSWLEKPLSRGAKLIVVDPRRTSLAKRADVWLQLKPGTDGALALGIINQLFENNIHDRNFCERWITGHNELRDKTHGFTPENISQITGVAPELTKRAAEFWGTHKPGCLIWGVSVDMNPGCVGTIHSLISLMALTGNIEKPGSSILPGNPFDIERYGEPMTYFPEIDRKPIGWNRYPLLKHGAPYGNPDVLLEQMESSDPYPIKAAWIQSAGVIPSGFADPRRVIDLFRRLEFIVSVDVFMNPFIALCSDLIIPAAMFPEKDSLYVQMSHVAAINKAIEPPGECKSDAEIILDTGKMIAPNYFLWRNLHEWINERLETADITFSELREIGSIVPDIKYRKYNDGLLRDDRLKGFNTLSGKIEIRSSELQKAGLNPLPHYYDCLSEYEDIYDKDDYPFILTTGARKPYFFGSEHRNVDNLRKIQPEPLAAIHAADAEKRGILSGDTLKIFSPAGECIMTARVGDEFSEGVIHCDACWWFPEYIKDNENIDELLKCNVNNLFPSGMQGPSGYGYPFRCFICNVEKI